MRLPSYRVFEFVNDAGLPTSVGVCHQGESPQPPPGETLRWLLASVSIPASQAQRLARERIDQICRWSTGDANRKPTWLRNVLPRPPHKRGRGKGRAVIRRWPDGRVERFAHVSSAARALNRDRVVMGRLLVSGEADYMGCRWFDDCGQLRKWDT
ncbi:MAG TPA: hypothetical protein VFE46_08210 [Pirellulales bacterium]|nr:hypothetical protein [Pirellulales bacterium]